MNQRLHRCPGLHVVVVDERDGMGIARIYRNALLVMVGKRPMDQVQV